MHDKHQGKKKHGNLLDVTVNIVIKMADTLPAGFYDVHFSTGMSIWLSCVSIHSAMTAMDCDIQPCPPILDMPPPVSPDNVNHRK